MKTSKRSDELIDLGTEPTGEIAIPLEEKYRDQMRQIITQKIDLPISTLPAMIDEQIDLSPDFQRRGRWDTERRSRFIESIIMNVPIPPVFLGEDEYGKYVVLDGRQRLTSIYDFMKNKYALKNLEVWDELDGARFTDLETKKLASSITRRFVPAVVILKESSAEVKYDVFDRLNTGGVIAEEMEIRNAVYRGEFTKLLHTLSDLKIFRQLWDIPLDDEERKSDGTYRRMRDLELVLRFFALQTFAEMNMNYRDYLSEFMGIRNKAYNDDLKTKDTQRFLQAIQNAWRIFGADAFRKPTREGKLGPVKSAPLADAVLIALSDVPAERIRDEDVERFRKAIWDLCVKNEDFKKAIGSGTNGKGAITKRIQAVKQLVRETFFP